MYLHLYYNAEKAVDDGRKFNLRMIDLQQELISGKRITEHEKDYGKFFQVTQTPVRGVRVMLGQAEMDEAKSRFGFFVMSEKIFSNKSVLREYLMW